MRRQERHHLKENALAEWLAGVQEWTRRRRRALVVTGWLVLAALAATGGGYGWREWRTARASEMLAAAMTVVDAEVVPPPEAPPPGEGAADDPEADAAGAMEPFVQPPGSYPSVAAKLEEALPQLLATAEAYPALQQGVAARYQAAAALGELGRTAEAEAQYRRVTELAGGQVYGRMARLGLAEIHLRDGAYDEAIALLEAESGASDSDLPRDAVLMRLGSAYHLAGQPEEAQAAFNRIVEEYPASPYGPEARREAEAIDALR